MVFAIVFAVFAIASLGFLAVSAIVEKLTPQKPIVRTAEERARLDLAIAKAFAQIHEERRAIFAETNR